MAKFNDILLNLLSGAIENVGESKLEEVLQQLHDTNKPLYEAALKAGNAFVIALMPVIEKSATKIDDAIMGGIADAIKDSATANGVEI